MNKHIFALLSGGILLAGGILLSAAEPVSGAPAPPAAGRNIAGDIGWWLTALLPAAAVGLAWHVSRAKQRKARPAPEPATGKAQPAEHLLQLLLDNMPSAFWIKDSEDDYRYLLVNDFYYQAMGLPTENRLEGRSDFDIHPHDLAEKYRADDIGVIESGMKQEFDEQYEDANGVRRCIHSIKLPLSDYRKDRKLLLGMSFDVTEIVEKRNRLQEANQLLQAIQDNLPCAFFVKDADNGFRYLMGNRTYTDFLSISGAELPGREDCELYPDPENVRACHESDLTAMEQGYSDADEEVTIRGKSHTLRCIKSRLVREDGRRLLVGICVDITEEKQLQEKLHAAMEELKIHAEQEHLLNCCLESALLNEAEDSAIRFVLAMVGERLKADHAYCFRYDYQQNRIEPCQEWTREGRAERLDTMPQFPIDPQERWLRMLRSRQMLNLPDVTTPEAKAIHGRWAGLMPEINVRSLYAIGVWRDGELWGHIGLSYSGRKNELTEQEKNLLQSCAHIVEVILERRKNRDELKRSEYEKLLLMDSIRIPIMLFNPDLKLIRCNNAALEIAGIPEEQIYRQECWKTFCGNECRSSECPVYLSRQDNQMHVRELRVKGRDYQLCAYPIQVDGKLVNIMKTMVDVTELNAIQRKLTAALEEAQNASKAKSYFLATMSHELRTPLNAVIGFSELLQNGQLPQQEHDDYLRSINLAGNSLLSLINDVLDLSKLEAEQMVLAPLPTDLKRILDEIRAVFQYKVRQKRLTLTLDCPDDFPPVKLDSLRLRQILLNLIGNAVKFTEHGGITVSIVFHPAAPGRGDLEIAIRDTGIGIPKEKQENIFEPFAQSDAARDSHAYQGTGLGLAISRRLAGRMGGRIRLESEAGQGSCFTLELNGVELALQPAPAEEPAAAPLPPPEGTRLLLVDDVPMNLKVLQAMLRKLNIESVCADSGKSALDILASDRGFRLVLTDLWMPGMSGSELALRIHANPETAQLPVFVITADSQIPEEKSSVFQGVLLKPVTLEALQNLLAPPPEVK
ncbi:MAG: PAS domain-containing protein [Lentisphaeria bacterium]|nr:PAS domain-containing protein [Lentisphaeria bacterium]